MPKSAAPNKPPAEDRIIKEMIRRAKLARAPWRGQTFDQFAAKRLFIRTARNGVDKVEPFILNAIQRRYYEAKMQAIKQGRPRRFLVLKYRQGGITTFEQGVSYRMAVTKPNSQCMTLSYNAGSTKRIFRMALLMHQRDPEQVPRRSENSESLAYDSLNSEFQIGTAGSKKTGRGSTLSRVHCSEVAWWFDGGNRMDKQAELISGLMESAEHGEMVMETTPNGSEWFEQTYNQAKADGKRAEWTPIFLPWFLDTQKNTLPFANIEERAEVFDTLTAEETGLIEQHGVSLEMIHWRRGAKKRLRVLFEQEYPVDDISCFLAKGTCWFDVQCLAKLSAALIEFPKTHIPGGTIARFAAPIPLHCYAVGVDASEGIAGGQSGDEGDLSAVSVIHVLTGEQVACARGYWRPADLAALIVKLAIEYNGAFLGIERNNHGHAVLQKVAELGYRNVYKDENDKAGWLTDANSRELALQDLAEALAEGWLKSRDRDFLDECKHFRKQSDGKFRGDRHDDTVIANAIAWQMKKRSRTHSGSSRMEIVRQNGIVSQMNHW